MTDPDTEPEDAPEPNDERVKIVESVAGMCRYPKGYLEELRKEWPD